MTKLSTVPYAYEPGLIARLLGVALEAANAQGGKVIACMKNRVSFPLINSHNISRTRRYLAGHELNPNRDVKRR